MFESYKKISIVRTKPAKVYFDGLSGDVEIPPFIGGEFDARINNGAGDSTKQNLIATGDSSANVEIEAIDGVCTVYINAENINYELYKAVLADGGDMVDVDSVENQYDFYGQPSFYFPFRASADGVMYATDMEFDVNEYQVTFFNGYEILSAEKVVDDQRFDVPAGTNRFTVEISSDPVKLPVRIADVFTGDGELSDQVVIAGTSGTIKNRIQNLGSDGRAVRVDVDTDANTYKPVKDLTIALASNDDYDLPDGTLFDIVGVSSSLTTEFTGFVAESGREVTIFARPNVTITFRHEDVGSLAANRINLSGGNDITINEYETVTFVYIDAVSRWYVKATG